MRRQNYRNVKKISAERGLTQARSTVFVQSGSLPREGTTALAWRRDPSRMIIVEGHTVPRVSQTAETGYSIFGDDLIKKKN